MINFHHVEFPSAANGTSLKRHTSNGRFDQYIQISIEFFLVFCGILRLHAIQTCKCLTDYAVGQCELQVSGCFVYDDTRVN